MLERNERLTNQFVFDAKAHSQKVTNLKRKKDIPEHTWKSILANIPIACVDIIVCRMDGCETHVLLGFRKICPYNGRWALPGGRIIMGESLRAAANRQLKEIGLHPSGEYRLVGVYPINFRRRSDISICLSTSLASRQVPARAEPRATKELVRYAWRGLKDLPSRLGSNYRIMLRDFAEGCYSVR